MEHDFELVALNNTRRSKDGQSWTIRAFLKSNTELPNLKQMIESLEPGEFLDNREDFVAILSAAMKEAGLAVHDPSFAGQMFAHIPFIRWSNRRIILKQRCGWDV